MASSIDLIKLLENGGIGKFLAETFHGERGRVYPFQDGDVCIVFPSEAATPTIDHIFREFSGFISKLGYNIHTTFVGHKIASMGIFISKMTRIMLVVLTSLRSTHILIGQKGMPA